MAARRKKKETENGDNLVNAKNEEQLAEKELKESGKAQERENAEQLSALEEAEKRWQQEKEELLNNLKRKQADIDNLRRISKQEQAEAREYALHEFLCRLLPVLDNLERALGAARATSDLPNSYVEGLEMIHRQLLQIIEQEGVSLIEALGEPFDPHCHHAVMQVESEEEEPGTVLEELQKGYRHRQRILRPAMVKVCKD